MGDIRRLERLYYDAGETPSFRGARGLLSEVAPAKSHTVWEWLRGQRAYTLHKPARRRFPRRPTIVPGPGVQAQADLMDVGNSSEFNDGVKFLLTIVDAFSRKAWAMPLKSKSGAAVATALASFFRLNAGYRLLQTDKGREFDNANVSRELRDAGVKRFTTENETIKASIVERFNRTLRERMHRYTTYADGERYIDALQPLVDSYNRTTHSSTGVPPSAVDSKNQEDVWFRLYESSPPARRAPRLRRGDHARISKARGAFERGYTPNWSEEVFVVDKVMTDVTPCVYALRDLAGEDIAGTFYEQELQLVDKPDTFRVAETLRERRRRGVKEYLVRWLGYPSSFNSWVSERDITDGA